MDALVGRSLAPLPGVPYIRSSCRAQSGRYPAGYTFFFRSL